MMPCLRHLVIHRNEAVTEQSPMAKSPEEDRDSRKPRERSERPSEEARPPTERKEATAEAPGDDNDDSDEKPEGKDSAVEA